MKFNFSKKKLALIGMVVLILVIGWISNAEIAEETAQKNIFLLLLLMFLSVSLVFKFESIPIKISLFLKISGILFSVITIFLGIEQLASVSTKTLLFENHTAVLYGCYFIIGITALFFAISGSIPISIMGTAVIGCVFGIVNYYLLALRERPLLPEDINGVSTLKNIIAQYHFYLDHDIYEFILLLLCIALLSQFLIIKFTYVRVKSLTRIICFIFAILVPTTIYGRWNVHGVPVSINHFNMKKSMEQNGSLVNFAAVAATSGAKKPSGYSVTQLKKLSKNYSSESIDSSQVEPDVVVILGESWSNLTASKKIRTNQPVLPNLDSIGNTDMTRSGRLLVNGFGGGTSRSEFELFTGTNALYRLSESPYQSYQNKHIPNLVSNFRDQGYDTTALHTERKENWNRDSAYGDFGFTKFKDVDYFKNQPNSARKGSFMSDSVLYDETLNILNESENPQFIFCITMQTHGDYSSSNYHSKIKINEPEGTYPLAEQYLGLMNDSDQSINAFLEKLSQRKRPTAVLMFGDHTPKVETEFLSAAFEKKGKTGYYETFYKIWSNYKLASVDNVNASILSTNYLGAYFCATANIPLTGYQKYLVENAKEYPVLSISKTMDSRHRSIEYSKLENTPIIKNQSKLQYNLIFDQKNQISKFFTK
ncbi:LTA synthase family protein [Enterococcus hermanniensis]|uniref:LTA synthase family protein n=1 Tax=Enterococcus hermanniensis TaxID=249189 RepID=UPI0009003E88|nr:alkaline phosphatase family protein [Enterococcus hermanniensis]